MAADPHSRLVSVLKVALPLVALAMLSTLFLLSSRIRPGDNIPFAEGEVVERIRGQQVTGPFFSGVTTGGDRISFSASDMITAAEGATEARNVEARVDFRRSGSVTLVASDGRVDIDDNRATLRGDVLIDSTSGYRMRTDELLASLSTIDMTSPGTVTGTGPAGDITAGRLEIVSTGRGEGVQLLFSDGVKLVYDPKSRK